MKGFILLRPERKNLNEFLNKLDLPLILKFLPVVGNEQSGHIAGAHVAKIQLTFFSCGGLVICACISHRVGDAATLGSFLKSWAATANKKTEETLCPNYDASSLFPQNDAYPREATWMALGSPFYRTGKFVVRRFVFDAEAIGDLKAKATSSSMQNPTRVEAVSALLSKCIMAAVKSKSGSHKPTLLSQLVNLRRKSKLQSLDGSMGNIIWFANAMCMEEEVELGDLVCKLREATTKVNGDFVESLQGGEGFLNLCKAIKDEKEACDDAKERITFSSLCNFGLYNVDFG